MFTYDGAYGIPGIQAALQTVENQFWVDRFENQYWTSEVIVGTSRDTGNTSYTTILRPGLLLGRVTSTGKLKEWNPTGTDGSQRIYGVLGYAQGMQRLGADQDRWLGYIMTGGFVRASRLLIPASTTFGISGATTEHQIRNSMSPRFIFDDQPWGNPCGGWQEIRAVTGDTTVAYADNNTLFTTRGAGSTVAFTLPALPLKGLRYGFYSAAAGAMSIASAGSADNITLGNDLTADSISYETASEIIGNHAEVIGDGTAWNLIQHIGREAYTVTVA
jgi:hypothetical protein